MDSVMSVSFCLTLKCNAKCDHCFADAGPERTEELRLDNVLKWISDIEPFKQVRWVSFGGGEAFLYKGLAKLSKKAKECNKKVKIFSNCFWATDLEAAKQILLNVMPNRLAVSADPYHQKFIKLENVMNAMRACLDLGIDVDCQMLADDRERVSEMRKEFEKTRVRIYPGAWVEPVGRAAQNGIHPDRGAENFRFSCDLRGKVVHVNADGEVYFCCRPAVVAEGRGKPFRIGNIYRSSLPDMIARIDPVLAVPQHRPMKELVGVIRAAGLGQGLVGCRTPCEMCCRMMEDATMKEAIKNAYSTIGKMSREQSRREQWQKDGMLLQRLCDVS